jgi:uncharacterized membrane protein (DUF485 family)
MSKREMNWAAIDADPRFQELHRKKTSFLWGLIAFIYSRKANSQFDAMAQAIINDAHKLGV